LKEIALASRRRCSNTGKYVALVDDCDYDSLNRLAWSPLVVGRSNHPLVYARTGANPTLMHRLVWTMANGDIPSGYEIDHVEHGPFGGLDNRRLNLRLTTHAGNVRNTRKVAGTVSRFRGVYWHRAGRKWAVQIHVDDYPVYLGMFASEEDAARAYDKAAREKFGEFARPNFPLESVV
jgi:hypothetical protein